MEIKARRCGLRGEMEVPGDKSISHRAVMLSGVSESRVEISNFLTGADCLSTIECMRSLGVEIERVGSSVLVKGRGLRGLKSPRRLLDAGNSGTTLRLLMGLLAGAGVTATFTGDESLSRRPMGRVIKPLRAMGASIVGEDYLPITIKPSELRGARYEMPVASAQVKSAILLAGLNATSPTMVVEPARSRDHTEKMLAAFGATLKRAGNEITILPVERLKAPERIEIPGDISSAAYWIVLAAILAGSEVTIKNVGVNETRTGILDVLKNMGAKIEVVNEKTSGGERAADLKVVTSRLKGIEFGGAMIPRLIDEIPIIAVAASFAEGTTIIRDVGELRVKESDRLEAIVEEFNKISPDTFSATDDSLIIHGGREKFFAEIKTCADHRMAMSSAIFGAAAKGVSIDDATCVKISYPDFFDCL